MFLNLDLTHRLVQVHQTQLEAILEQEVRVILLEVTVVEALVVVIAVVEDLVAEEEDN